VNERAGSTLRGVLYVAASAMMFAAKGLFAKKLYTLHVGVDALVMIRAVLAMPLFWIFAARNPAPPASAEARRRAIAAAAFAGFICYYVGALVDFHALTMIDASVERVLLFSYPAFVVLILSLRARSWPTLPVLAALALTYAGIFFSVGGFDLAQIRGNAVGGGLVLCCAVTYAFYYLIAGRFTHDIGSARFTTWSMSAAAVALAIQFLVLHDFRELAQMPSQAWVLLVLLAVFGMFIPALLQAEGIRRIGAQRGSVVSTVGPPTTIALAWLLLDERISIWQMLGVVLIVAGILVLDMRRAGTAAATPDPGAPASE
jgi:drug/metabolite transporter (DMT)-like permease